MPDAILCFAFVFGFLDSADTTHDNIDSVAKGNTAQFVDHSRITAGLTLLEL